MNTTAAATATPKQILETLKRHYRFLLVPTILATIGAAGYAVFRQETWKATQAISVRDEAIGNTMRQGRFNSSEAMKSAQETILDLARNRSAVAAALAEVGPPATAKDADEWPSQKEIEKTQAAINVIAPKGAEFGSTEVIRLEVKGSTQQRAIAMVTAVCNQIDIRLQDLRNRRAQSILQELQKTVELAQADLDTATRRLEAMEKDVGPDLGELRTLSDKAGGESSLRTTLSQVTNELRQARVVHASNEQKHALLSAALQDPTQLVATPNQLLESQPALRRLKEGLVDAQLRTAQLAGKMSNDHPLMQAAVASEQETRRQLNGELEVAVRGLNADRKLSSEQVASLERQVADVEKRMNRLAGLRARYANLVESVRNCNGIVERAKGALSEAEATQTAARSTSLLTRMDKPETGENPVGPGPATMVLAGMGGGLLAGVGLVFLVAPIGGARGRRWSDYLPMSRRATDRVVGRRTEDQQAALKPKPANQSVAGTLPTLAAGMPSEDRRKGDRRNPTPQPEPQEVI